MIFSDRLPTGFGMPLPGLNRIVGGVEATKGRVPLSGFPTTAFFAPIIILLMIINNN